MQPPGEGDDDTGCGSDADGLADGVLVGPSSDAGEGMDGCDSVGKGVHHSWLELVGCIGQLLEGSAGGTKFDEDDDGASGSENETVSAAPNSPPRAITSPSMVMS